MTYSHLDLALALGALVVFSAVSVSVAQNVQNRNSDGRPSPYALDLSTVKSSDDYNFRPGMLFSDKSNSRARVDYLVPSLGSWVISLLFPGTDQNLHLVTLQVPGQNEPIKIFNPKTSQCQHLTCDKRKVSRIWAKFALTMPPQARSLLSAPTLNASSSPTKSGLETHRTSQPFFCNRGNNGGSMPSTMIWQVDRNSGLVTKYDEVNYSENYDCTRTTFNFSFTGYRVGPIDPSYIEKVAQMFSSEICPPRPGYHLCCDDCDPPMSS